MTNNLVGHFNKMRIRFIEDIATAEGITNKEAEDEYHNGGQRGEFLRWYSVNCGLCSYCPVDESNTPYCTKSRNIYSEQKLQGGTN